MSTGRLVPQGASAAAIGRRPGVLTDSLRVGMTLPCELIIHPDNQNLARGLVLVGAIRHREGYSCVEILDRLERIDEALAGQLLANTPHRLDGDLAGAIGSKIIFRGTPGRESAAMEPVTQHLPVTGRAG